MSAGTLASIGAAIGNGITAIGTHSARAAAQANGISAAAQSAQGAFNQASADNANTLNNQILANQYGYNSANMQAANDYNSAMWQQTAAWNEEMWERQAEFNRVEAQKQREWSERMDNTRYQRAIKDMSAAGLNPILAVTGGGIDTGGANGATATVGGAQMSSAQSAMTSGGLLGANQASESNYTGQMEYLGGTLGLISAVIGGLSSAMKNLGSLGDIGEGFGNAIAQLLSNPTETKTGKLVGEINKASENWNKSEFGNTFKNYPKYTYNYWKNKIKK